MAGQLSTARAHRLRRIAEHIRFFACVAGAERPARLLRGWVDMAGMSGGKRRKGRFASPGAPPVPAPLGESVALRADAAASYLKALSHEGRLMILCHLTDGEKSVTELEALLTSRQSAISQQLSRLRSEGLVEARREGKVIYYSLGDPRTRAMIATLTDIFCR